VIAGPNGSGKSTFTKALDLEGRENLLDPDAIARRMNSGDPRSAAMAAGREVLESISRCLDALTSFAIETTLASKRTLEVMSEAKARGFLVNLIYVCLDTPERNIRRVQERVSSGGHDVPDQDIRRRYLRSLGNLPEAIQIADRAILYDNSEDERRRMLEAHQGSIVWIAANHPQWVDAIRGALSS